jgi:hypothetical protein
MMQALLPDKLTDENHGKPVLDFRRRGKEVKIDAVWHDCYSVGRDPIFNQRLACVARRSYAKIGKQRFARVTIKTCGGQLRSLGISSANSGMNLSEFSAFRTDAGCGCIWNNTFVDRAACAKAALATCE